MSRYSVQRSEREMILNDIQGCQIKRVRIGTGIASTLETTDVITDALTCNAIRSDSFSILIFQFTNSSFTIYNYSIVIVYTILF